MCGAVWFGVDHRVRLRTRSSMAVVIECWIHRSVRRSAARRSSNGYRWTSRYLRTRSGSSVARTAWISSRGIPLVLAARTPPTPAIRRQPTVPPDQPGEVPRDFAPSSPSLLPLLATA